jgi:hypothetical protein
MRWLLVEPTQTATRYDPGLHRECLRRCGMPFGHKVFAGNRNDATTLEEIVTRTPCGCNSES